jgi:hypothetical protein
MKAKDARLPAVFADGFDWAGLKRSLAFGLFFRGSRLLIDIRIAMLVLAGKVVRRLGPASVTVDALVVNVKLSGLVVRPLLGFISHIRFLRNICVKVNGIAQGFVRGL